MPAVSIIVPIWNEESYLIEALSSLLRQTYTNFEVIIVDDGSTDNSAELIKSWCAYDSRFRAVRHATNKGIGAALNRGFQEATGEYQTWVSADSWVEPEFLSRLVEELDKSPTAVLAYSDWYHVKGDVKSLIHTGNYYKKRLQRHCYIGPCWLFRRTAKEAAGQYPTSLCEDYYMHLRLAELGDFIYVPEPLGAWRDHPNNSTNRISLKSNWRESSAAKAKARWGSAKYKVAYICPHLDCAGVGWLLTNGINDLSNEFAFRHILNTQSHMASGFDLLVNRDLDEIVQVMEEADLIYVNNEFPEMAASLPLSRLLRRKPNIFHLHGGPVQWNRHRLADYQKTFNSTLVSCTPGLDFATWIPNYMPVNVGPWPLTYSRYYEPLAKRTFNAPLRFLCHHNYPTGKGIDQVNDILSVIRDWRWGSPTPPFESSVRADLNLPLWDHLSLKRGYHVCVDQLTHGYLGMASWEAMAQGLVVLARIDPISLAVYREFWGESPPVINCRFSDELASEIAALLWDPERAEKLAQNNREWAVRHYNGPAIVKHYERLLKQVLNGSLCSR